jgi:hypothetical protein
MRANKAQFAINAMQNAMLSPNEQKALSLRISEPLARDKRNSGQSRAIAGVLRSGSNSARIAPQSRVDRERVVGINWPANEAGRCGYHGALSFEHSRLRVRATSCRAGELECCDDGCYSAGRPSCAVPR